MFVAIHTAVNWGPHGIWLYNCSDDTNSTTCDYAAQITWKVTNIMMKHYHDKRLLGRLDGRMIPLILESPLINRLGLNKETSRNLLQTSKNLELGLGISQVPIIIMVTISFIIINHISYKLCPPSFCYNYICCLPLPLYKNC